MPATKVKAWLPMALRGIAKDDVSSPILVSSYFSRLFPRLTLAHLALCAAEILRRAEADIVRLTGVAVVA